MMSIMNLKTILSVGLAIFTVSQTAAAAATGSGTCNLLKDDLDQSASESDSQSSRFLGVETLVEDSCHSLSEKECNKSEEALDVLNLVNLRCYNDREDLNRVIDRLEELAPLILKEFELSNTDGKNFKLASFPLELLEEYTENIWRLQRNVTGVRAISQKAEVFKLSLLSKGMWTSNSSVSKHLKCLEPDVRAIRKWEGLSREEQHNEISLWTIAFMNHVLNTTLIWDNSAGKYKDLPERPQLERIGVICRGLSMSNHDYGFASCRNIAVSLRDIISIIFW